MYPFSGLRGLAATKTSFHLLELEQDAGIRMAALTAGSTANHLALSSASRRPDRNTLQGLRRVTPTCPVRHANAPRAYSPASMDSRFPSWGGLAAGKLNRSRGLELGEGVSLRWSWARGDASLQMRIDSNSTSLAAWMQGQATVRPNVCDAALSSGGVGGTRDLGIDKNCQAEGLIDLWFSAVF